MEHITLSDAQLSVVAGARDLVAVQDEQGRVCCYIALAIGSDELDDARRALASRGPRYTTAEVLAKLDAQAEP